jgi:hypothetical protein
VVVRGDGADGIEPRDADRELPRIRAAARKIRISDAGPEDAKASFVAALRDCVSPDFAAELSAEQH